jgi:hypothetical protein
MKNHEHREALPPSFRDRFHDLKFSLHRVTRVDPAEPARRTENVGIDGDGRLPEGFV